MAGLLFVASLVAAVSGQGAPERHVPATVLAEVQVLEGRFELALAEDCAAARCFSKGCAYVDHAVADQPRASSLPGLGEDAGPGSVAPQEYLTQARCAFAYEQVEDSADVQALARRLQARLSRGWTAVTVTTQALPALPAYLREAPTVEAPEPAPAPAVMAASPEPAPWTRQLWDALLPHLFWMVGLALATLAALVVIWAWRRVGRISPEEQALLAGLAAPPAEEPAAGGDGAAEPQGDEAAFVAREEEAWRLRLDAMDRAEPDPALQAMIRELLRAGEYPLLAKAMLRFPEVFAAAFPAGAELAAAKLELAAYLRSADEAALPSDHAFYAALQRHARSTALETQGDARVVRSLREDFGTAGLARLVGELPPRLGALLYALVPPLEQDELLGLLGDRQVADLAWQLLSSNRMDPQEAGRLFEVLRATREGLPQVLDLDPGEVTDRGATFDAEGALSTLLARLPVAARTAVLEALRQQFRHALPSWLQGVVYPDLLLQLSTEARADLFLEVPLEPLAAWLSVQDPEGAARLGEGLPEALRRTLRAAPRAPTLAGQFALAAQGRRALAEALQRHLARTGQRLDELLLGRTVEVR